MSQLTNSPSSPKTDLDTVAGADEVGPASNTTSISLPAEGCVQGRSVKRDQSDREGAQGCLDPHLEAPQEWEPEIADFDFDFTVSPGAEEWQIGETADGRAVYSTVVATGVGVTVEFQKWDW